MAAPAGTIEVRGTRNVGGHYYTHNKNRDHNVQMILMRKYNNNNYYWAHGNNTSKPHLSATHTQTNVFPKEKNRKIQHDGGVSGEQGTCKEKMMKKEAGEMIRNTVY